MATQGPNSGGTFAGNVADTGGSFDWANPSNAASSDNSYATTATIDGSARNSNFLKTTNFGFTIPSGATIDGITVEIEKKANTSSFNPLDFHVQLVKGGTIQGTNKASASVWPTSDTYSTFGVAISVKTDAPGKSSVGFFIDHIRITVNYTASGGGGGAKVDGVTSPAKVDGVTSPAKVMGV